MKKEWSLRASLAVSRRESEWHMLLAFSLNFFKLNYPPKITVYSDTSNLIIA